MEYLSTPLRRMRIHGPRNQDNSNIHAIFRSGQSFIWTKRAATALTLDGKAPNSYVEPVEWVGALAGRTLVFRQEPYWLYYRALYPKEAAKAHHEDIAGRTTEKMLLEYFANHVDTRMLYTQWMEIKTDRLLNERTQSMTYGGMRVLKQDPWETLIAFICSSNNNVGRITLMIRRICQEYGTPLPLDQYSFPTVDSLAVDGVEERLRELGFGYRAPYIAKTAQMLAAMPAPHDHLESLKKLEGPEQRAALEEFAGVGPKVADCVRLFGLQQHDVVPIDTHMARVAVQNYGLKYKEGKAAYDLLQKKFKALWGTYAGWAQQVLFAAELGYEDDPQDLIEGIKPSNEEDTWSEPDEESLRQTIALAQVDNVTIKPKDEAQDPAETVARTSQLSEDEKRAGVARKGEKSARKVVRKLHTEIGDQLLSHHYKMARQRHAVDASDEKPRPKRRIDGRPDDQAKIEAQNDHSRADLDPRSASAEVVKRRQKRRKMM